MDLSDFKVTIVGLGLLGGSFALALRDLNPLRLFGVDVNAETIDFAESNGIVDKGYMDPTVPLGESDIVIICVYPNEVVSFIENNKCKFKKGALIADIAGIKECIAAKMEQIDRKDIDIICSHPMAGNEYSGIIWARKEIFQDANYIITPLKRNKEENLIFYERLMKSIGFGSVSRITPSDHDRVIALTSQLSHVVAVAIVNSDSSGLGEKSLIGGSFRDTTRVALINSDLWSQLLIENKTNVIKQIDLFKDSIEGIREAIIDSNHGDLQMYFNIARERRKELSH